MRNYVSVLLLCFCSIVFGKSLIKFQGRVLDNESKPLIGAQITLQKMGSPILLKTAIADENGDFIIEANQRDSLMLIINFTGFKTFEKSFLSSELNEETVNLGTLRLEVSTVALGEVSVVAQKQFVQQKIDRVVVNPEALISNHGVTALEVLEKSPGIAVDMNGNITMRGKNGVMIFIDDKPTQLAAADLSNYLRSIPSNLIASVEIMTNPPAKYDAAGNAGIINIKMKKNSVKGFNGGVNLALGQGRYFRTNNSANLNYRVNKVNLFANLGTGLTQTYQDLTIERNYFTNGVKSSSFTQNTLFNPRQVSSNAKLGLDYYASANTTLGISVNGIMTNLARKADNNATVGDKDGSTVNKVKATNPLDGQFRNGSVNMNATHKLPKSNAEINFNYDYVNFENSIDQVLTNYIFSPTNKLISFSILESDLPTTIDIHSSKLDWTKTLSGGRMEAGLKSSIVNTSNIANFYDKFDNQKTINNEFSNNFQYKENINAGYLNYSKDFKKWSIQTGLRAEQTNADGDQLGNAVTKDSSFNRSYVNVFPTFFAQYRIDSLQQHVLGINVGRRIDRPNYKDLNPFTYPMDRYTFYGGNPFLQPTFSVNTELSYTYKSFWTTTLMYSMVKDVINETNEQRGSIYYSRPGNFDEQISYGVTTNLQKSITKRWTLQLYSSYLLNKFKSKVYTEQLDDQKWYLVFAPVNMIKLGKNWSTEIAMNYQSTVLSGQFVIQPIYSFRAGLSKTILKNKGTLRLSVSDLFYTNQIEGEIRNISNAEAGWFSYLDTRVATMSFGYRFSQGQNYKPRQTGASDAEQKRVKNT
jgi:iron complex outermembrane recepter protein